MTLKEKMLEILPGDVSDAYAGGVKLCPSSYSFLEGHFKIDADDACVRVCVNDNCENCWNQPYIEDFVKDINVPCKNEKQQKEKQMTLKEAITILGKYCHSREDCDKCGCYAQEYGCVISEFGINNYGDILKYVRDEPIEPQGDC